VLAVLCSDLDHLNAVNDRYGHAVGDAVLVEAATRITRQLRAGDTAARLGGDEFVVVCEGMLDQDEAVGVARRIERAFLQPFDTGGPRLAVSVSVGVAVADGEMHSPDALLRDADQAMYRAKKRGRARYELSDGRVGRGALADLRLERELRAGLDAGELVVYYQPLVVPSSGRVTAVEALVRWRHPRRGLLLPQAFLEVAEASGLVPSLGHEVLRQACAAAAAWRRAGGDIELSVNISAAQLGRAELAAELTRVLKETGLPPAALWLEITEHALVEASGSVLADVAALKALGVRLAIDDFGTGYSSLTYLRDLPVDAIKVDRSFVAGVATDARDRALVASVVGLGRELGLRTVAEGVESAAHAQALSELGPDLCQGFYFGPPAPELPVVSKVG
jgi:diguanylate cyclase (GGDEF)-like protein